MYDIGLVHDIDGNALGGGAYALCLTALPMGFSWSFWLVQEMHYDALRESGFPAERCIVGSWPVPNLWDGPVVLRIVIILICSGRVGQIPMLL